MKIADEKSHRLLLFHQLYKVKHFIRTFIGVMILIVGHIVVGYKILAPKFINLKSAFINVKMYISLVKIRRAGAPDLGFGVKRFNGFPSAVANARAMLVG